MKTNVSISIDEKILEQLKQIANAEHVSLSALLQKMIYKFLENNHGEN